MNTFKQVDQELSIQIKLIEQIANELLFKESFKYEIGTDSTHLPFNDLNFPGVYLFEILNNNEDISSFLTSFKAKWEIDEYKPRFVPNTKLKRLARHSEPMEWVPLYIGKSKNVSSRVKDHFHMKMEKNTFAMKILDRKNLDGLTLKISSIQIDVENYDLIVPKIERYFRDKINPIVGR